MSTATQTPASDRRVALVTDGDRLYAVDATGRIEDLGTKEAVTAWMNAERSSCFVTAETGRVFWLLFNRLDRVNRKRLQQAFFCNRWIDVRLLDGALRMAEGEQEPTLRRAEEIAPSSEFQHDCHHGANGLAIISAVEALWPRLDALNARQTLLGVTYQAMGAVAAASPSPDRVRIPSDLAAEVDASISDVLSQVELHASLRGCVKRKRGGLARTSRHRIEFDRDNLSAFLVQRARQIERHRGEPLPLLENDRGISFDPHDWQVQLRCDPLLRLWSKLRSLDEIRRLLNSDAPKSLPSQLESWPRLRHGLGSEALELLLKNRWVQPICDDQVLVKVDLTDLNVRALLATSRAYRGFDSAIGPTPDNETKWHKAFFQAAFPDGQKSVTDEPQRQQVGEALAWLITHRLDARHLSDVLSEGGFKSLLGDEEAQAALQRVLDTWPELRNYYEDGLLRRLVEKLDVSESELQQALGNLSLREVSDALSGEPHCEAVFRRLSEVDKHRVLYNPAWRAGFSPDSFRQLAGRTTRSLTCRTRGTVLFGYGTSEVGDLVDDFVKCLSFLIATDELQMQPALIVEGKSLIVLAPRKTVEACCKQIQQCAGLVGVMLMTRPSIVRCEHLDNSLGGE
jgi:hypothetical protein